MLKGLTKSRLKPTFGENTPEDVVAQFVDRVRQSSRGKSFLVKLLPEEHPIYKGKGVNQTIRLRGYILSAFGEIGLPDKAVPYVLDELENGIDAYLVAASAIALRGSRRRSADVIPYLFKAIENIRYKDDSMTFDCYKPLYPLSNPTTALKEIFKTFAWMGAYAREALPELQNLHDGKNDTFPTPLRAEIEEVITRIKLGTKRADSDCCSISTDFRISYQRRKLERINAEPFQAIDFQDENGKIFNYTDFFSRQIAVVAFFYTRCDNPNRCSLTVTKIARLQKALIDQGLENNIKTAAITYDPSYDSVSRIKAYGQDRGALFSKQNKMLRTVRGFEDLLNYFQSGVNFVNSIINKHRIELYILDSDGKIAVTFSRLQWNVQEVIEHVKLLLEADINKSPIERNYHLKRKDISALRMLYSSTVSVFIPLAVVFFPKCPICWAAYLSLFGLAGLQSIPYSPWLLPVFVLLMLINLVSIFKRSKYNGRFSAFYLSCAGMLLTLLLGMYFNISIASYLGVIFIFVGSLINSTGREFSKSGS